MNIKIITRHSPSNYGSLLQSVAIIKTLEQLGHKAEIIDYKRKDERGVEKVWTEAKWKYNNSLKRIVYTIVRYPIEKYAEKHFDKMRASYLVMTKKYSTHEQLATLDADVFMTGSDQVWGPMVNRHYDSAYFLQFAPQYKKVSYAASFGKTKFDDATIADYKCMLKSYDKIAVREDFAVQLLESWGMSNCIGQVLDPTLLLTGDEWREWAGIRKTEQKNYVLVYQLHNDSNLSSYAKRLANKMGMELVRVNPFIHQAKRGGRFICCPDVKEFLSLIDNSSMMITDSFHGTCFAINMNKQFVEILPNNATGSRNQSILKLTGLSNRIVTDFDDLTILDNVIDYSLVNDILNKERIKSLEVMKQLID